MLPTGCLESVQNKLKQISGIFCLLKFKINRMVATFSKIANNNMENLQ